MLLNLRQRKIGGREIFPKKVVRQVQAPQIQLDRGFGAYHRYAYGFGLYHSDLEGELTMHHFGGPIHLSPSRTAIAAW